MPSTIRRSSPITADTSMRGSRVLLRDLGTTHPMRYSCELHDETTGDFYHTVQDASFSRSVALFHERCDLYKVSSGGSQ